MRNLPFSKRPLSVPVSPSMRRMDAEMTGPFWRTMKRFIRQLKRTPMMRDRAFGSKRNKRAHSFIRIHMLFGHEPARFISANRENC